MPLNNFDFVQVGTWLLPESYGQDYDHFTQTRMPTKDKTCIAVFAKVEELRDFGWAEPLIKALKDFEPHAAE